MKQSRTQIFTFPSERYVTRAFHAGVSLHSHTEHSQERLDDLPRYLDRMPVVSQFLRWERKRYLAATGANLDFSRAYWRGPLSAQSAYELECSQIGRLGLRALVSLTDHDTIDAGLLLQAGRPAGEIPISVEWTVPYEQTYFHIGIHNLHSTLAISFMQEFANYTRKLQAYVLGQLFEALEADPSTLVVLNHPLWDMGGVGRTQLTANLRKFFQVYGRHIHALEINGLRSWPENLAAAGLAGEFDYPVVAGGDRHGLEPNAVINLTRANTFAEFAEEIRVERSSDIAVLPQYQEPLAFRHLLCAWDAVREHPQFAGRQYWVARVFVVCDDGVERPLSALWTKGTPAWIDPCLNVIGVLASPPVRTAARLAYQAAGSPTP
ncbi:MAG: hypothetical protein LAO08_16105 [Acidobacteriia bacterium]|nr:hypothetical protein [Terriglobia bacterium]